MRVTICLLPFFIAFLLFLPFSCSSVKSPSPSRTIFVLEESRPGAKKIPAEIVDDPEEKTLPLPVSKIHLKPLQKSVPDFVKPDPEPVQKSNYYETGKASFYADKFQSRKTASGELFDQKAKTAAHKQLPFGTKVKVTNKQNQKSVIVTINDRGPFVKGRIIDLSLFAFSRIGDTRDGLLDVEIQIIDANGLGLHDSDPNQS